MGKYYNTMSASRLRDLLDQLEEQLYDYEIENPEDYCGRNELKNLINNICDLLYKKEAKEIAW